MRKYIGIPMLGFAALALSMLACNFPFVTSPTPFVFPTPDLTMTALFNPTSTSVEIIFPTQTLSPAWSSPTATPPGLQPTSTPTNTPLPPTDYSHKIPRTPTALLCWTRYAAQVQHAGSVL